jgi:quercetin dioxygenase-like cupin family protein
MTRRIVTGHDAQGRSVILSDGPTPTVRELRDDGARFFDVWATGASPAPVTPVEEGEPTGGESLIAPPAGGSVVRVVELAPGGASPLHRTETVDYGILLEGELYMVLDSGAEVRLSPGDVVVQRGTDHAWQNRSKAPARMVFVLLDGKFEDELRGVIGHRS